MGVARNHCITKVCYSADLTLWESNSKRTPPDEILEPGVLLRGQEPLEASQKVLPPMPHPQYRHYVLRQPVVILPSTRPLPVLAHGVQHSARLLNIGNLQLSSNI